MFVLYSVNLKNHSVTSVCQFYVRVCSKKKKKKKKKTRKKEKKDKKKKDMVFSKLYIYFYMNFIQSISFLQFL